MTHGYKSVFAELDVTDETDDLGDLELVHCDVGNFGCMPCGTRSGDKNLFRVILAQATSLAGSWADYASVPAAKKTTYATSDPGVIAGWNGG